VVDIRADPANTGSMSQGERRFLLGLIVLPWLALAGGAALAAEGSVPQANVKTTVAAKPALTVEDCQKAAERQAAQEKGWNSVEWTEAAHAGEAKAHIALTGRAHTATGWTAFTALCTLDKRRQATATLDPEPVRPSRSRTLDLSATGATPAPNPAGALPLAPDLSDRNTSESSGSSGIKGTLSEIRPDIPTAPLKKQDFFHDHRFGIKIETPF
jgi:hypothetical protein